MRHVVTTETYGYKLEERPLSPPDKTLGTETVTVDPKTVHQTIIGFGGAFTEASAYNLSRVSENVRKRVIKAYFNPDDGIGYTLGRVSVHGCDFSLGSYLYIDDYDDTLESFSIERDRPVINMIKDASRELGQDIRILASPWTPPFWMKDNHSPIRGGKLIPSYDGIWARYLAKFVEAYRKEGIDIFALTLQNEPMAVQRWDSCIYEDADEVRFLKVLGKTLHDQGMEDIKLYIWDHNRDLMVRRAQAVYSDPEAARYAYGTAFHWYENEQFEEVGKHKTLFPDKHLLFTEGCQENGPHFGDWSVGIRYGRNIINDLMNGNEGHIDWNLVLDDTGGPNHVNNLCSSPVMLKIFHEEVVLNPSFHVMGQFSKFIRPGAKRLEADMSGSLKAVAFENADGSQVLVVMNETDDEVNLRVTGLKALVETTVHAKAFHTFVL